MTIEEAEKERGKLVRTVKLSDASGISRIDYLNGWVDCYNQSHKPEKPWKVKDFPKKLRKEIKEEVERQGKDWVYKKEKALTNSFCWTTSKKGHDYWLDIYDIHYGI